MSRNELKPQTSTDQYVDMFLFFDSLGNKIRKGDSGKREFYPLQFKFLLYLGRKGASPTGEISRLFDIPLTTVRITGDKLRDMGLLRFVYYRNGSRLYFELTVEGIVRYRQWGRKVASRCSKMRIDAPRWSEPSLAKSALS